MQNSTLEIHPFFYDVPAVGRKKPITFRPDEDVKELLKAGVEVTGKSSSELLNEAVRQAMATVVAESKKLGEEQRQALMTAVNAIRALKPGKRGDKPK
jgi:uncharacterized protein (DUF1778 family)